jgi:hypothetical protein
MIVTQPCYDCGRQSFFSACGPSHRRNVVTQYLDIGWVSITIPNLIVIGTMLMVFAVGLVVKLPGHKQK